MLFVPGHLLSILQTLMNVAVEITHARAMQNAQTHPDHSPAHAKVDTWEMDTIVQVSVFCDVSVVVMTAGDSR